MCSYKHVDGFHGDAHAYVLIGCEFHSNDCTLLQILMMRSAWKAALPQTSRLEVWPAARLQKWPSYAGKNCRPGNPGEEFLSVVEFQDEQIAHVLWWCCFLIRCKAFVLIHWTRLLSFFPDIWLFCSASWYVFTCRKESVVWVGRQFSCTETLVLPSYLLQFSVRNWHLDF